MSNQPRVAKVLAALLLSMTTGAVVLMVLSDTPPSAGPFCLSSYYRLDPIEQATFSRAPQSTARWDTVEVYYSGTNAGNIDQLASVAGLPSAEDTNCHFIVCNGLGGNDGQIQTSAKWLKQWSVVPGSTWYGSAQTIRICVISNPSDVWPSDLQISRTTALIESLCRKFDIAPQSIYYPDTWQ